MSKDFDNTNTGILSRNEKRSSDKAPEFTGKINVGGTDYRLAAWVRERKDGSGKFFSLKVSEFEEKKQDSGRMADMDDSLPF